MNSTVKMPVNFQIGANKETADWLKIQVNEIENDRQNCLKKAVAIGAVLYQVQQSCQHGEFTRWLDDYILETKISRRSAFNYMALTKNQKLIENADSVREALEAVEKKNREEKNKQEAHSNLQRVANLGDSSKVQRVAPTRSQTWDTVYINETGEDKKYNKFLDRLDKLKDDQLRYERCAEEYKESREKADLCKRIMAELRAG